ncbi:BBE domain-containing protein [Lipingzhangella sp. LS1_29]|uniref:BBE domain-containing protein n=1 Tax=Lipingzhangella rawalii TaxID=2055835 RepID=A0ABU2H6J8_9ACTN|nr:BBE domain-containing protein [Lipingzhangella rawalii]
MGGVLVLDTTNDGCYHSLPDVDMLGSAWNSAAPWHHLFYQNNDAQLQTVTATWGPRNVFHRALSLRCHT